MKSTVVGQQTIDEIPTMHRLVQGDARDLSFIPDASIHLVVTSPPYWTLKRYNDSEGQMASQTTAGRLLNCFLQHFRKQSPK